MDKYKETFETWNKVAELYQDKFMNLDLYNASYDIICDSIKRDRAKLLEIGCGPGNITKYLLAKRPDFEIVGIDIAPNMIELAKKNNPSAEFKLMDSRNIDELNSKFDGIICGFCIPYLSTEDCNKLIGDSYNLLNDQGFLYLSFVEGDPEKSGFLTGSSGDRCYFYYHDLTKIVKQLKGYGFQEINVMKVEYARSEKEVEIHTIVMAKKTL